MRDSMKMTVRYQFLNMLLMHIAAAGVTVVFGFVAFWYFMSEPIWKEILSVVFMIVYFMIIYIRAKKFALLDNKPYTPLKLSMIKGVLFGVFIAAVTMLLLAVFKGMWAIYGGSGTLGGVIPTIVSMVFYYWTFPYNGIMGLSQGMMTWYSVVIMALLPIAASWCGYFAGSRKIELVEKFEEYMYEKEDKND